MRIFSLTEFGAQRYIQIAWSAEKSFFFVMV